MKLTPTLRAMLARIRDQSGTLQARQITANGRSETRKLEKLIAAGYAEIVDHPTVKERTHMGREPTFPQAAAAVAITEAGRTALTAPAAP